MRADKLTEVSEKLKIAVKNLNTAQKEYEKVLHEYQLVESSFDIGEEVRIVDMTHAPLIRSKLNYIGAGFIHKIYDASYYDVKMTDGKIHEKVSCAYLVRIER